MTAHQAPGRDEYTFDLSPRLLLRIRSQFAAPGSADEIVKLLRQMVIDLAGDDPGTNRGWHDWGERLCGAVILLANGDSPLLIREIAEARTDWRDVLMAADLGDSNWPARLDALFGPPSNPATP
jgi:hypothetical protein